MDYSFDSVRPLRVSLGFPCFFGCFLPCLFLLLLLFGVCVFFCGAAAEELVSLNCRRLSSDPASYRGPSSFALVRSNNQGSERLGHASSCSFFLSFHAVPK
jgi:hypothetical protein